MLNETRDFVGSAFAGTDATGTLETLFTSTSTMADANLAKIYGVTINGDGAQRVSLPAGQRAGIFTQLAFLTTMADESESHPVKRGDALLRRAFCVELHAPMNMAIPPVDDPVPGGATTRQRFEKHSTNPCATCHSVLDPLGFAFEGYDTIGAFRTMDQGKPVETGGTVTLPTGTKLAFKDAVDLLGQLPKLPEVKECVATQWMRYMLGRRELDSEAPSLKVAVELFTKSNDTFRDLLVALTKTRTFTHRSISEGEVIQ
jgi:hypothetical protein